MCASLSVCFCTGRKRSTREQNAPILLLSHVDHFKKEINSKYFQKSPWSFHCLFQYSSTATQHIFCLQYTIHQTSSVQSMCLLSDGDHTLYSNYNISDCCIVLEAIFPAVAGWLLKSFCSVVIREKQIQCSWILRNAAACWAEKKTKQGIQTNKKKKNSQQIFMKFYLLHYLIPFVQDKLRKLKIL